MYVALASANGASNTVVGSYDMAEVSVATSDNNWSDSSLTRTVASGQGGVYGGQVFNYEGYPTPGGTKGTGNALGGSGFWLGAPTDAQGRIAGTATLKAGAVFALDFKLHASGAVPADWDGPTPPVEPVRNDNNRNNSSTGQKPTTWNTVSSVAVDTTSNGIRKATNAVPLTVTFSAWTYDTTTKISRGTITFKTTADMVVGDTSHLYNQINFNKPSVTFGQSQVAHMATRGRVVSGTVVTAITGGASTATALTSGSFPQAGTQTVVMTGHDMQRSQKEFNTYYRRGVPLSFTNPW